MQECVGPSPYAPAIYWQDTAVPDLRFECLDGCGLCCSYTVDLDCDDIERLKATGRTGATPYRMEGDQAQIKKNGQGFCVFLDPDCRCGVYAHRPGSCRAYPLIPEHYCDRQLDVDYSCPGIGFGQPMIEQEDLVPSLMWDGELAGRGEGAGDRQQVPGLVENVLRLQGRWADTSLLPLVAAELSRDGPLVELHGQRLPDVGNLCDSHEALAFAGRAAACAGKSSVQFAMADPVVSGHLDQGILNTRLEGRSVTKYRLARYLKGQRGTDALFQMTDGTIAMGVAADEIADLSWTPEALDRFGRYMDVWVHRQLSVRFAHAMALADAFHRNMVHHYLGLLQSVRHHVILIASIVGWMQGSETVTDSLLLEAIRGTDGLMRARCANVRIQV